MKTEINKPYPIHSIAQLHRLLTIPPPQHPLVSVINFADITCFSQDYLRTVRYSFYCIALKKGFVGNMKYGQRFYDFDEGVMTFFAPGQIVTTDLADEVSLSGWWLVVHGDYLKTSPAFPTMKSYTYFGYAVNEALHLSRKEEKLIAALMSNIRRECRVAVDQHSQDIMLAHITLLLGYCSRFYSRQFLIRKQGGDPLLTRLEDLLTHYFDGALIDELGLPTVHYVADQLHVSSHYLSDSLRALTGQSTQQHIHNKLIEKAKELILGTDLSINDIAYRLGFGHPQSFNKLFKLKTNVSPLAYRRAVH